MQYIHICKQLIFYKCLVFVDGLIVLSKNESPCEDSGAYYNEKQFKRSTTSNICN
jgi:hypothetical protein